jgi:hypothetical protein
VNVTLKYLLSSLSLPDDFFTRLWLTALDTHQQVIPALAISRHRPMPPTPSPTRPGLLASFT